jgi:Tfp pilus assembly protein PilF
MTPPDLRQRIESARDALRKGDLSAAAQIAGDGLAEDPDCLDLLEVSALVEVARGEDGAAEATLRRAIAVAPDRRWPYGDLARLLLRLKRADEAEAVARSALEADPRNADAHAILASIAGENGQWTEAAAHFEQAIALAGAHPELLTGLGLARLRQGRLAEARAPLERARTTDRNAIEPLVYLAELEEKLGNFGEALQLLDQAEPLARARGTDVDLQRSVLLARMGRGEDALALLDGKQHLSGAALLQRGRLRDGAGRFAEAWDDWTQGKALLARHSGRSYRASDVQREADALRRFFTAATVAELPRAELRRDVPQPIFILGFPRSGTTLTEQILASHSAIRAGGELPFGGDLRSFASSLVGGEADFPAGLARLRSGWPERLRDVYLERAESYGLLASGAQWFTDKMPSNDMWLPLLRLAFPHSPAVLVRRHPLDVLTSVMAHNMTHGFSSAYRLEDAASHLALVEGLVDHFREAGVGPTHDLHYEALVANQERETRLLVEALGLQMEPSQLRFYERTMVSPTPSYAQVKEPLNDRSVQRWRNYAEQLAPVQPIVVEAMVRGGYTA